MNLFLFLHFILFLFTTQAAAKENFLSVCAIFQDEGPYLREWIEYHRLLGFEHFYLYNNNSVDDSLAVLAPYVKKKLVTVIDWPSPAEKDGHPIRHKLTTIV